MRQQPKEQHHKQSAHPRSTGGEFKTAHKSSNEVNDSDAFKWPNRTPWNTMNVSLLHFASQNLLRKAVTSCYMQNTDIYRHTWLCSSLFFRLQESLSHHESSLVIPFPVDTTGVSCAAFFAPIELAESTSLTSLTWRISALDCFRCGRALPVEEFALAVRRVVIDAADSCRPWKSEGLRPWLSSDREDLLRLLKGSNIVREWFDYLAWTIYLRCWSSYHHHLLASKSVSASNSLSPPISLSRSACQTLCSWNQLWITESAFTFQKVSDVN